MSCRLTCLSSTPIPYPPSLCLLTHSLIKTHPLQCTSYGQENTCVYCVAFKVLWLLWEATGLLLVSVLGPESPRTHPTVGTERQIVSRVIHRRVQYLAIETGKKKLSFLLHSIFLFSSSDLFILLFCPTDEEGEGSGSSGTRRGHRRAWWLPYQAT